MTTGKFARAAKTFNDSSTSIKKVGNIRMRKFPAENAKYAKNFGMTGGACLALSEALFDKVTDVH